MGAVDGCGGEAITANERARNGGVGKVAAPMFRWDGLGATNDGSHNRARLADWATARWCALRCL